MAHNKKSFVLYVDIISTVELLTDEQAGVLFKLILDYVNDKNPEPEDILIKLVFQPIKMLLKRDLKKWESYIEQQRIKGMKGGRPKTQKTRGLIGKPKKPVSVSVSVSESVSESVSVNILTYRIGEFKNSLLPFLDKYGRDMLNEFFMYWTKKSPQGIKMRFELSKNQPFNVSRRLATWNKNEKKFNPPKTEYKGAMQQLMEKHKIKKNDKNY